MSCVVIKWNSLEGYHGLTKLAERRDNIWNVARNQETAGGLSNRALVRSWAMTNAPPWTPNCSLKFPGPGGKLWLLSPGLYAHLRLEARAEREKTGSPCICGRVRPTLCPPMTTLKGRREGWVSKRKSRCC